MLNMTKEQFKREVDDIINHNGTVGELKHDVAELKHDVAELKHDVAELKHDVAILKQDSAELKHDVSLLKHEQHRQGILLEDMSANIRTIVEAVTPLLKGSTKMSDFENSLQEQKVQIEVTQSVLRHHIDDNQRHNPA